MAPNLMQLAPNLSAEERYKIVMADCMAQIDGEPAKITESELKAMIWFQSKPAWREYALHVAMMRHANEMWIKEIETEKIRAVAFYLHVSYQFELIVWDGDAPKDRKAKRFETLKESVADLHEALEGYYVYRDAIPKLEAVLYGVPFFAKKIQASIDSQIALVEDVIRGYNEGIRRLSACHDAKKFIRPIVEDMDSYLVKDAIPTEAASDELVDFIKHLAETEMNARN